MWKVKVIRPDGSAGALFIVGPQKAEADVRESVKGSNPLLKIVAVEPTTLEELAANAEAEQLAAREEDARRQEAAQRAAAEAQIIVPDETPKRRKKPTDEATDES